MSRPLYNALVESKNRTDVLQYSTQFNLRNHYASIIRLSGDTLLAAFTYYTEDSVDVSPSEIFCKYSYDNGKSWTDEWLIIPIRSGKSGSVCPNLYKKLNGNIICLSLERNEHESDWWGQIYQYESTDNGLTWDEGVLIYESSDYQTHDYIWIPSNQILKTSTGRLIISMMIGTGTAPFLTGSMNSVVRHLYSDDEGANWSLSATVLQAAVSGDEALIGSGRMVQMSDGTIVEIERTRSRYTRITKSIDNGATWSNPPVKSATLIISNADVELYCKNNILYAFASRPSVDVPQIPSTDTRIYLDLWKSIDSGNTWTFVKNLLYDSSVHVYTEPIVFDFGSGIIMFYSYYPYGTDTQDLRFERLSYVDLES